jgi:para-nitrobenzyl esterase
MTRSSRVCIAIFAIVLLTCAFAPSALAKGGVRTDKGTVIGTETAQVKEYLGIPYAAPPVGNLRWRPPQPAASWSAPLDASHFANHCPQVESPFGTPSGTEDCLYLNVYSPKSIIDAKGKQKHGKGHLKRLPVMVWFHGGGMVVGESDDYDPTRLVQQGVVVVTLNYRLGFLGFLAHPALSAESGYGGSGNYGLMDQQAALQWVQRNIDGFGGDRSNVTIFGQSAGGLSVHSQLASPLAGGLFERAIAQSGAYSEDQPSLAAAEADGAGIATAVGCSNQTATCLRSVPVQTLLSNQPTEPGAVGPNLDGKVLPQSTRSAFASGQFNGVPVIEGSTHDEFTIFTYLSVEAVLGLPLSPPLYPIALSVLIPATGLNTTVAAVMNEYPLTNYQTAGEAFSAVGTDAVFACPGRRTAKALSQFVPTYAYEFNDPNAPQPFVPPASFPYKAFHASELAYLFDSTTLGGHAPFTPDQEALAAHMVSYWTQFARSGTPNGRNSPQWPAYTNATDTYQSLEPPTPKPTTGFAADHHCAFWDAL